MKKLLMLSSMFIVVAMAAVAVSASAAADFSGTWALDPSKSTQPQGPGGGGGGGGGEVTLTVKQDAKTLTVTRTTARGEQVTTYNLDGSESTAEGRMGKSTYKTKWQSDGKILQIDGITKGNIQGNEFTATSVAHWELGDGGKTLKIHSVNESPQGKRESTQVFNKK